MRVPTGLVVITRIVVVDIPATMALGSIGTISKVAAVIPAMECDDSLREKR